MVSCQWNLSASEPISPGASVRGEVRALDSSAPVCVPAGVEWEVLNLEGCKELTSLPDCLIAYELNVSGTSIKSIPSNVRIRSILDASECHELVTLPKDLSVGTLRLRGCRSLVSLPENLDVWFLDLSNCWAFQNWPEHAKVRTGNLNLRGCTALRTLPEYLGVLASLNIRDCSNLIELPDNLRISGWIDIAQSGLAHIKEVPNPLKGVDIRWQGVRISERIWLAPESIVLAEIFEEKNTERRRILIERFGQSRFMQEANAEVLDRDADSGGERQLIRVPLDNDEPIVTLACKCPSTARQYYLRVPPDMKTCRQAAAWMAGYDNPDDYVPVIET